MLEGVWLPVREFAQFELRLGLLERGLAVLGGIANTYYFLLPTSYFLLLPTSYFLLPTSYCLLPTTYYLLPTLHQGGEGASRVQSPGTSIARVCEIGPSSAMAPWLIRCCPVPDVELGLDSTLK